MWKEGRPARDHGLKEWQDGNFSGFFLLYIPDLGLERQQPRPNNGCRKSKGPGKGHPIKTENFYTIAILL